MKNDFENDPNFNEECWNRVCLRMYFLGTLMLLGAIAFLSVFIPFILSHIDKAAP